MTHYDLLKRIDEFLINGGLFNPEYMNQQQVQRLMLDIRDFLKTNLQLYNPYITQPNTHGCSVCGITGINGYVCSRSDCPTGVRCS